MALNYKEAYAGILNKNEWQLDSYELAIHSVLIHLIEKIEDLEEEIRVLHNNLAETPSLTNKEMRDVLDYLSTIKVGSPLLKPEINSLKGAAKKDKLNDRSDSGGNQKT